MKASKRPKEGNTGAHRQLLTDSVQLVQQALDLLLADVVLHRESEAQPRSVQLSQTPIARLDQAHLQQLTRGVSSGAPASDLHTACHALPP